MPTEVYQGKTFTGALNNKTKNSKKSTKICENSKFWLPCMMYCALLNEPGELSQQPCYNYITIDIVPVCMIITRATGF